MRPSARCIVLLALATWAAADNVSLDASSSNASAANVTQLAAEVEDTQEGAKAAEPATDAPGELLTNSTKADVGNRSNATLRGMLHGHVEAAPMQSMAWLLVWICCCSFCCYSASHQDEVRTMILRRDQRQKMAEIVEKEMVTRSEQTVGSATSFDGLLAPGSYSSYTPPQL
eukprot:s2416_g10.t1